MVRVYMLIPVGEGRFVTPAFKKVRWKWIAPVMMAVRMKAPS